MTPPSRGAGAIPPLRLTRAHLERLPPRTDNRAPAILADPPSAFYEDTADDILSRLGGRGEVWVFAAGSLMWRPRMDVAERRTGTLKGWRRSFCISDRRYRGSPGAPGLMMSIDRGEGCDGVVLRMECGDDARAALVDLLDKEPPVPPELVPVETHAGDVTAILFAASPDFPLYTPEPPIETLADILASAVGHVGTMAEYLLNTVTELNRVGVYDAHLWRLQDMVAERLERGA